jgi:predicted permease
MPTTRFRRLLFNLALRAWPRPVRDRHRNALAQTFDAAWTREPARRRAALVADLVFAGLRERVAVARHVGESAGASTQADRLSAWMSLGSDLRSATRALRARPLFTAAVVLTLGLGLGATTAIFSIVEGVLLRPLPYPDDDRLVLLGERDTSRNLTGASMPAIEAWRTFPEVESLAAWEASPLLFGASERIERVQGATVSLAFFTTLGVNAAFGRTLLPSDPPFDETRRVVLGYELWRRVFDADPAVVGRTVTLEGRSYDVLGVMPPGFSFPDDTEFWRSLPPEMRMMADAPTLRFLDTVARVRPGAAAGDLLARLHAWKAGSPIHERDAGEEWQVWAASLREHTRGGVTQAVVSVFIGVGLLLVIACANVAALLVANGRARASELATRAALGASRARLIRQLLLEGLLLSIAGGGLALLITAATRNVVIALSADQIPRIAEIGIGAPVVVFTLAVSLAATLLVALGPAWTLTRVTGTPALQSRRTMAGSRASRRLFGSLVALEFAMAVMLVAGAGLLLNSYRELHRVETGVSPDRVGIARVVLPLTPAWRPSEARLRFFAALGARVRALPGVQHAGFGARLPLTLVRGGSEIWAAERPDVRVRALNQMTSAGYFDSVGTRLMAGRTFGDGDVGGAPPVAVVNTLAAARLFGDAASAIGREIQFDYFRGPVTATVVGVVAPVRYGGLTSELRPELYLPLTQGTVVPMSLVYRSSVDPASLVPAIRRAIAETDPTGSVALDDVATLSTRMTQVTARPRFFLVLVGVFASLAFLLAACGIYGTTAYWLGERCRELGLRIALGASPGSIVRSQIARGLVLAATGIVAGLGATWAGGGLIRHFLFGIEPGDPGTLLAAGGVLGAAAIVACWVPARRVGLVDPADTLRSE